MSGRTAAMARGRHGIGVDRTGTDGSGAWPGRPA